jgi:hypothetical protein
MRALLVSLCVAAATAQQQVKIGDLQTLQHGVSGEVYAVDESRIRIKHFNVSTGIFLKIAELGIRYFLPYSLIANCYSATSMYNFAIATPLLF